MESGIALVFGILVGLAGVFLVIVAAYGILMFYVYPIHRDDFMPPKFFLWTLRLFLTLREIALWRKNEGRITVFFLWIAAIGIGCIICSWQLLFG